MRYLRLITCILLVTAVVRANEALESADALMKQKKYDAARVLLEAELRKNPDSVLIWAKIGYIKEKQDFADTAKRCYTNAVIHNQKTGKDPEAAEVAAKRLIKLEPAAGPVFQHGSALVSAASKYKEPQRSVLRNAGIRMMSKTFEALLHQPAPEPEPKQLTEKELEKNLGYNLGWAPRDAVEGPNGHKYKFFDEKVSWEEARKRCEKAGGFLVTVTSEEEQKFLLSKIIPRETMVWSGLKQFGSEGWITGEPCLYTKYVPWINKRPRHPILLHGAGDLSYHGKWGAHDSPQATSGYICEWVK